MAIKYKWLAGHLKEMIRLNIEKGIEKLPTEQELCERFRVSRQTVRLSLSLLEDEGLIVKKRGSGSFITGLLSEPENNVIGILVSDDQDYIYPGLINDIQTELLRNSFHSKIYVTGRRTRTERRILTELLNKPVRGLIVEGCRSALPNPNTDLYRRLQEKGAAILFLNSYYAALNDCPYIKDDNLAGSSQLVRHLTDLGHTAIGGIFPADELQGIERYQGFTEAMRDCGLPVPDEHIGWFLSRDADALANRRNTDFLRRIIRESLGDCTAVICYNDMIAYYLIQELRLAGQKLPEDMSVASFDNTYLSSSERLTITSLSHRLHETGTEAARMMIRKLKGLPVQSVELPWELREKQSTEKLQT